MAVREARADPPSHVPAVHVVSRYNESRCCVFALFFKVDCSRNTRNRRAFPLPTPVSLGRYGGGRGLPQQVAFRHLQDICT